MKNAAAAFVVGALIAGTVVSGVAMAQSSTPHVITACVQGKVLQVPDDAMMAATVTIGKPVGGHGPVRRRPLDHFVFDGPWGSTPAWAVDPPDTRHTSAGPPRASG